VYPDYCSVSCDDIHLIDVLLLIGVLLLVFCISHTDISISYSTSENKNSPYRKQKGKPY
jgi:hypothetical protein